MEDRELQLGICGEYIGLLRVKAGMSAEQLSRALEREPSFIARVEKGETLLEWDDFRDEVVILGGDILAAIGECVSAFKAAKGLKNPSKDAPQSKRFARTVRFLRHEAGMTQRDFSIAIGRKPSYVASVERNGSRLDVEAVIAIAEFCEIDVGELLKMLVGDEARV